MKRTMKGTARETSPDTDPWRYGERHLRRVGPDGQVSYERVPLRKEDLLFPQEGDRPVLTDDHSQDWRYLFGVLDSQAARHPGRRVFGDHRIDFQLPGLEPLGPDLIVLEGVGEWDGSRGTFPVVTMGARPLLVLEITSPDTRENDLEVKPALYYRCKIPGYAVVDRQAGESRNEVRVLGFRRTRTRYAPVAPDERGWVWLEPVGLRLGVADRRAVCFDSRGRSIIPPQQQAAAAARARRKAEREKTALEERVRELEAELRRARGKQ
jgi:Uma2 family endonuclease